MHQLNYILPPLLGWLIGYVTNSLAVKMLFHPYKSIRIGTFRIPFTPGMIPKRQDELSVAMGRMIQNHLLTSESIQKQLLSPEVKSALMAEISAGFFAAIREKTIGEAVAGISGVAEGRRLKEHLAGWTVERILVELQQIDLRNMLAREAGSFLEKNLGGFAALFISGKTVSALTDAVADRILHILASDGKRILRPYAEAGIEDILSQPLDDTLIQNGLSQDHFLLILSRLYDRIVQQDLQKAIAALDVAAIVENKVAAMDVRELEQLITSIMKRELRGIINLGGLIGAVLGALSLLL
ncbi:MAG TPA: DUF445 family protein [Anaerovoracaceae bacterium]|nr:DUF445 family protein [Anaerovoracaceae bacterium]